MAELLDLNAEVLRDQLSELTGWLADLVRPTPVRRILDLGAGTGTGSFALLRRFPDAEVIAVDASGDLLEHLRRRAREHDLADRVSTVRADLDEAWPDLGEADLAWISAALHHLAEPERALHRAYAALRPGGTLAVVEHDGLPRFLPDDLGLGRPGLEDRCRAELARQHADTLPHLGADWAPRLSRAGFTIRTERQVTVDLASPLPEPAVRYAQTVLQRLRTDLDGRLTAEDLATLDALLDPDGPHHLRHRDDLAVRTTRAVWVATRP